MESVFLYLMLKISVIKSLCPFESKKQQRRMHVIDLIFPKGYELKYSGVIKFPFQKT